MGSRLTTLEYLQANFLAEVTIQDEAKLSFQLNFKPIAQPVVVTFTKKATLDGNFNLLSPFYFDDDEKQQYITPAYNVLAKSTSINDWFDDVTVNYNKNAISSFDLTIKRGENADEVLFDKSLVAAGSTILIQAKIQDMDEFIDLLHGISEVPAFTESVRNSLIRLSGRDRGKLAIDKRDSLTISTGTTSVALIKTLFARAGISEFINYGVTEYAIPGVVNIQENKLWDSIMRVATVYNYIVGVDQYGNAFIDEPHYIRTKLPAFIYSIGKNIFQSIEETVDTGIRPNIVRVVGKRSTVAGAGLVTTLSDEDVDPAALGEIEITGSIGNHKYVTGNPNITQRDTGTVLPSTLAWMPSSEVAISAGITSTLNFEYPIYATRLRADIGDGTLPKSTDDYNMPTFIGNIDLSGFASPSSQVSPIWAGQPDTSFASDFKLSVNWQHSGRADKSFSELWKKIWVDQKLVTISEARRSIGRHRNFDDKVESRILIAIPFNEPYFIGNIINGGSFAPPESIQTNLFKSPYYLLEDPIELLSATNVDVALESAVFIPTNTATMFFGTGNLGDNKITEIANLDISPFSTFAPEITLLIKKLLNFGYVKHTVTLEQTTAVDGEAKIAGTHYVGLLKKTVKFGFLFLSIKLTKDNNNLTASYHFKLKMGKIKATSPRVVSGNIINEDDDAGKGRQIYIVVRDPQRVQKYGEVWADPIENDLIRSIPVAREAGRRALLEQRFLSFSTSFETVLNPFIHIGDVIQVENIRLDSVIAYPVESLSHALRSTSAKTKIDINRFIGQEMKDKVLGIFRERTINEYGFIDAVNEDKTYDVIIKGRSAIKKRIPAIDGFSGKRGDEVVIGSINNDPYNNIILGGTGFSGEEVTEIYDVSLLLPATVLEAVPSDATVTLNWLAIVGAISYNLYYNETNELVASGITNITYDDTGLTNLQQYCYYVKGVDEEGFEGEPSNVACAVPTGTIPPPVIIGTVEEE